MRFQVTIADNQHFLSSPQCVLLYQRQITIFVCQCFQYFLFTHYIKYAFRVITGTTKQQEHCIQVPMLGCGVLDGG